MNLGLAGVCNGTDLTSTFTPPPPRGTVGDREARGVKVGPGASRDSQRGALARAPQSLLFIGPALTGFLQSLFSWLGAGFFSVFLFLPSLLRLPSDRSALPAPTAPREGRNLEKVSQKFGSEQGREDQERKRERGRERRGRRERIKMMKSSLHRL